MTIAATAPRGGLAEDIGGRTRALILRNAEIERFEDAHCGIYALWDGFFGRAVKPTTGQIRDLVALGLVGGGMTDTRADAIVTALGPDHNLRLYQIAQALLGVALMPDAVDDDDGDGADAPPDTGDEKKNSAPAE